MRGLAPAQRAAAGRAAEAGGARCDALAPEAERAAVDCAADAGRAHLETLDAQAVRAVEARF